jgi:hypothetical protein
MSNFLKGTEVKPRDTFQSEVKTCSNCHQPLAPSTLEGKVHFCSACGQAVNTNSTDQAPGVGNPHKIALEHKLGFFLVLTLVGLAAVGGLVNLASKSSPTVSAIATPTAASTPISSATVDPNAPEWTYSDLADGMTSGRVRTANLVSSNSLSLPFPYEGVQHARLILRRHPRWGKNVILTIEKGQILCHDSSFEPCYVQVRFDDGKAIPFHASNSADHDSSVIFINGFDRFVTQLKKAKRLSIEIVLFQAGTHTLEFKVGGLDEGQLK